MDRLPEPTQQISEFLLRRSSDILEVVIGQIQREAALVALQKGKPVSIDFHSGDTPITTEVVQSAIAALNSTGYSLLVIKASSNTHKLLVAKHSRPSKPQSCLLWVAPSTVSSVIGLAWNRALRKVFKGTPKIRSIEFKSTFCERSIDSLLEADTGCIVPWLLYRDEDGSYWLDARKKCVNRPKGTASMPVKWTRNGPLVYLPSDFDYQFHIEGDGKEVFKHPYENFKWVLVNSKPQ